MFARSSRCSGSSRRNTVEKAGPHRGRFRRHPSVATGPGAEPDLIVRIGCQRAILMKIRPAARCRVAGYRLPGPTRWGSRSRTIDPVIILNVATDQAAATSMLVGRFIDEPTRGPADVRLEALGAVASRIARVRRAAQHPHFPWRRRVQPLPSTWAMVSTGASALMELLPSCRPTSRPDLISACLQRLPGAGWAAAKAGRIAEGARAKF